MWGTQFCGLFRELIGGLGAGRGQSGYWNGDLLYDFEADGDAGGYWAMTICEVLATLIVVRLRNGMLIGKA